MYASPRERAASALAAFCVVLLLVLALVFGLRVAVVARESVSLVSILLEPPKPPEPKPRPEPPRHGEKAAKGAPAPRGLKNHATPVVAPPVVPLIVPPPIVAATQAGTGRAVSNGASDRPGPGQGAGGFGNGDGGGGEGGNGSGGVALGPRQIHGRLSFSDLPDGLLAPGAEARVGIRYVVDVDGSVVDCRVDQPSGYRVLDGLTCRLVSERFRFKPARDFAGRPVRATIAEAHTWFTRERGDRD